MTRLITRNAYKYPLIVGLPEVQRKQMPRLAHENPALTKFITGTSVALLESLITCPMDRLKVHLMTQQRNSNERAYVIFWREVMNTKVGKVHEIFRGFGPLFARQCVSWSAFLQTDYQVKSFIRK